MIDPVSGATVHARYAIVPKAEPGRKKLLPKRPLFRPLKCVWYGTASLKKIASRVRRILEHCDHGIDYYSWEWCGVHRKLTGDELWGDLWRYGGHKWFQLACYAVTGNNEGHRVYVELVGWDGLDCKPGGRTPARRVTLPLFSIKTFGGWEAAQNDAKILAALLNA